MIGRLGALVLLLLVVPLSILAGTPVDPSVKNIVAFVFVDKDDGTQVPRGTAFFVGVPDPADPAEYSIGYLVTAKHVLKRPPNQTAASGPQQVYVDKIHVRMNKTAGGVQTVSLPLVYAGEGKNVFFHEDPTVDLAVVSHGPRPEKFDYKFVPDGAITTKEDFVKLRIREGHEIFFVGLLWQHLGRERNQPVVRFGRVASVTDEKVDWNGELVELYLMEVASWGGNSGSPVFFYLGADREPGEIRFGNPIMKLAGIVKGHLNEPTEGKMLEETSPVPVVSSNIGIAGVIPAYKLYEILHGEELSKQRTSLGASRPR